MAAVRDVGRPGVVLALEVVEGRRTSRSGRKLVSAYPIVRSTPPLASGDAGRRTTGRVAQRAEQPRHLGDGAAPGHPRLSRRPRRRCRRRAPRARRPGVSRQPSEGRAQVADGPGQGERDRVGAPRRAGVVTRPNASRVRPRPTGTWAPVCHQSTWPISPGRYVVRWKARAARNAGRTRARCSLRIVIPPRVSRRAAGARGSPSPGPSGRPRASPRSARRTDRPASPPAPGDTAAARRGRGAGRRCCGSSRARRAIAAFGPSLAMEEPMDLGPVLHLVHSFLLVHELCARSRVPVEPGQGCSGFDRREVLSIRAASTLHNLPGGGLTGAECGEQCGFIEASCVRGRPHHSRRRPENATRCRDRAASDRRGFVSQTKAERTRTPTSHGMSRIAPAMSPTPPTTTLPVSIGTQLTTRNRSSRSRGGRETGCSPRARRSAARCASLSRPTPCGLPLGPRHVSEPRLPGRGSIAQCRDVRRSPG